MGDEGLWEQWRRAALAIRALAHISVAAESTHSRPVGLRAGMLGASLAADVWIARRRHTSRRRRPVETLINVLDVAAWSSLTRRDPIHMRGLTFATLAPNAMEAAFRLRAGTRALPVLEPAAPWRPLAGPVADGGPESTADAARRLGVFAGRILVDALPSIVTMAVVRHRRGLRLGLGPFAWVAAGAVGGFTLARIRDRAQADTTAVWEERTRYLIEEARIRSRVQSALVHNITAVDPKALLTYLERAGSVRAGHVLDEIATAPATAVSNARADGLTLSAAVDRRAIRPEMHQTRWIPRAQVRMIRDAMARIDEQLEPWGDDAPDDGEVTVASATSTALVLSYRGRTVEAAQPVPDLAIRLEPTTWPIVASWVLTAATTLPSTDRASAPAFVFAFAAHGVALARLLRKPAMERRADRVTGALLSVSALVMDISIGQNRPVEFIDPETGERVEENAGTTATQAVMMLLGTSWHDLRSEAPVMLGVALAGWIYSLRLGQGRSLHSTIAEAAFLVMPLLANLGTGRWTRVEAELLDETLQARLSATIADTARIEARDEIGRFVAQLDCVIAELPRLHPSLSDAEVDEIIATYTAERDRIARTDPLELIGW